MIDFWGLDRKVTFQRATTAANDYNEPEETWSDLAKVMAGKRDASDREQMAAQEVQSTLSARIRVRWMAVLAGVTAKDRVVCEGVVYDVAGRGKQLGRREGLEFTLAARGD